MARNRPIAGQRARVRATGPATQSRSATSLLDDPAIDTEPSGRPEDHEQAQRSPDGADAPPRARLRLGSVLHGWSRAGRSLLAGLLALLLVALAAFGLVAYRVRADQRVETARDQAAAAAQSHAVSILSYDYRHLDQDFAAARKTLTGSFARDYRSTTSQLVRPGAVQYHVVVKAEVAAESIVRATADRVVVLLFVNQTTTSTRLDGPRVDLNRVRLTLVKVDGSWLVNNVDAL